MPVILCSVSKTGRLVRRVRNGRIVYDQAGGKRGIRGHLKLISGRSRHMLPTDRGRSWYAARGVWRRDMRRSSNLRGKAEDGGIWTNPGGAGCTHTLVVCGQRRQVVDLLRGVGQVGLIKNRCAKSLIG